MNSHRVKNASPRAILAGYCCCEVGQSAEASALVVRLVCFPWFLLRLGFLGSNEIRDEGDIIIR